MKYKFIKRLLCLMFLSIGVFSSLVAQRQLSEESRISLLSCEPGKDVYARFGHTGIRIYDPVNFMDLTFHYGIFSYDTPFFIAKFVQGATDYEIGLAPTEFFMNEYIKRNSSVHEQVLNLNLKERQTLYNALVLNYQPENRLYRYNFIFDNCATRPYHIINNSSSDSINYAFIPNFVTYRDVIHGYVGENNWLSFGIDLVIGSDADVQIDEVETISFPLFLMNIYDKAEIVSEHGNKPLVLENIDLFVAEPEPTIEEGFFTPNFAMWLLFALGAFLTIIEYIMRREFLWFDGLLFGMSGFIGCVIFYLMFISSHPLVQNNFNILWLNPLQLIFAFALIKKSWRRALGVYQIVNSILIVLALIIYVINIQNVPLAFFPLMLLMLIRSSFFAWHQNKTRRKHYINLKSFRFCLILFFTLLCAFPVSAKTSDKPKLVVMITIDGLQSDLIDRYWESFSYGGFRRLIDDGYYAANTPCSYITTGKATDYASLYTGSYPLYHGIVSEYYFNHKKQEQVSVIDDVNYSGINSLRSVSPVTLQTSTIADELKLSDPRSKVYAIGLNPAEAIMMGGHMADGAVWIDDLTGEIATTTYYNNGLPRWAAELNEEDLVGKWKLTNWQPEKDINNYQYRAITQRGFLEQKPTFYRRDSGENFEMQMIAFKQTPHVNQVVKELVTRTIRDGKMGYDDITDLLALTLNANSNFTGYGPCAETEDMYIKLDRTLAEILDVIDITIGLKNAVVAVTTNHQEHRSREYLSQMRIPTGNFNPYRTMAILNSYLMAVYGQGRWIDGYYARQLYFNKKLIEDNNIKLEDIEEFTAQFLLEFEGVHSAYSSRALQKVANVDNDRLAQMRNSYFKNRSGDVVFNLLPGWYETDHLDRPIGVTSFITNNIPIIFYGIDKSKFTKEPMLEDIVPTLCQLIRIPFPNGCVGTPVIRK